jgi:hypothetical protein
MDSSHTPFDEKTALEELERLRDAIQAARRARMAKSDEFDQFVKGFKKPAAPPPSEARDPEPPAAAVPAIELPAPSPVGELLTLTPAPEQPVEMAEPLTSTSLLPSSTETVSTIATFDRPQARPVDEPRPHSANRIIGTIAVAAVALIGGLIYWSRGTTTPVAETPANTAEAPAPAVKAPPAPAPAPAAPVAAVNVELRTLQPVWMRVTVDGQKQREGTVPAGERLQLHADRAIVIRAGNGGDVVVKTATGENPLGAAGQPITFTFTKAGGGKQ